jgi:hypothetical protein
VRNICWTEANTHLYKMYRDLIWNKLFCDVLSFPNSCCICQAKCQKSYLLNTLVLQELIIYLSLHSRSAKNKNYSHIYWIITCKIIDQSGWKTDQPKPGLFRWPSNRGSKKPRVRGCIVCGFSKCYTGVMVMGKCFSGS